MTLDHRYNVAYWADVLTEQEFLQVGYRYCEVKGRDHTTIRWLYRLGQDYNKVTIPYEEFYNYMADREPPRTRRRGPYRWSRVNAGPYREGTAYRKNADHEKKEKTNQNLLWRQVTGMDRDKRRRKSWSSNRKKTARKAANGSYRQWCKRQIERGNFDTMSQDNTDWKFFNDPWDWD